MILQPIAALDVGDRASSEPTLLTGAEAAFVENVGDLALGALLEQAQLLEFLANSGADLELGDNTGTTPLAWARKNPGRSETYQEIAENLVRLEAMT